ncbi:MAG: geranylgeranyl reductase family protein [Acidimicrobiales bacterium]
MRPGNAGVDVVVVGAGPAGSTAALVLARGGARVAVVDKTTFPRDKACGDLIGPRGVQLLHDLGVSPKGAQAVGEMVVVGPTGRRVLLPARAGRRYPGYALAVPRARFDAQLREAALDAGAVGVDGRFVAIDDDGIVLADGRRLTADAIIGADGATSLVADAAGLVSRDRVLWGFAVRSYVATSVERPVIALWNDSPRRGFPGYGWLFPSPGGAANIGLGLGMGAERTRAARAARSLDDFVAHLQRVGVLDSAVSVDGRRLGGWLKMGIVGTAPAHRRVLLVGDAAGLVNPLQGEGIAQAMESGQAAAMAMLAHPAHPEEQYRVWLRNRHWTYSSVTSPVHAAVVNRPKRVARLARVLTAPGIGSAIAPAWALYWNDLLRDATPSFAAAGAAVAQVSGRVATAASRTRRLLREDLAVRVGIEADVAPDCVDARRLRPLR